MPLIIKDKKQYLISKVRSIVAQDHQMSLEELQLRLEREYNLKFERHYLSSLVKNIYRERAARADRYTLNAALAAFEDTMTQVVRVAWSIANDEFARKQDRVAALKEIREANNAIFDKLFDAGVFERKLGTMEATIRNTPLPEDRKQAIRAVFQNWGLIPQERLQIASDSLQTPKEDAKPDQPASGS